MAFPIAALLGGAALGYIIKELLEQRGAPPTNENVQAAQELVQSDPSIALNTRVGQSLSQLDRMPTEDEIHMAANSGGMDSASDINAVVDKQIADSEPNPRPKAAPRPRQQATSQTTEAPPTAMTDPSGFSTDVPQAPTGATAETSADAGVLGVKGDLSELNIADILYNVVAGAGAGALAGQYAEGQRRPVAVEGVTPEPSRPLDGVDLQSSRVPATTEPALEGELLGPRRDPPNTPPLLTQSGRPMVEPLEGSVPGPIRPHPVSPGRGGANLPNELLSAQVDMVNKMPFGADRTRLLNQSPSSLPFEMAIPDSIARDPESMRFIELLRRAVRQM